MQDEDFAWRPLEALASDAEYAIVFAQRGDVTGLHALELQAQHVQCFGPLDRLFDAIEHRARPCSSMAFGSSDRGPHTATSAPSFFSP